MTGTPKFSSIAKKGIAAFKGLTWNGKKSSSRPSPVKSETPEFCYCFQRLAVHIEHAGCSATVGPVLCILLKRACRPRIPNSRASLSSWQADCRNRRKEEGRRTWRSMKSFNSISSKQIDQGVHDVGHKHSVDGTRAAVLARFRTAKGTNGRFQSQNSKMRYTLTSNPTSLETGSQLPSIHIDA